MAYEKGIGQEKIITGTVIDSVTRAPLQNVTVRLKNASGGALTDSVGKFKMTVGKEAPYIVLTSTGYKAITLRLSDKATQHYTIRLVSLYTNMGDVLVKFKKSKYHNKNNPAVELIRQVIAHKASNQIGAYPYATYREYEKMQASFVEVPHRLTESKLLRRFHFMFENVDSLKVPGKKLIPFYISESLSDNYFRRSPEKKKTVIVGQKSVNYGEFIDMKGILNLLSRISEPVNIYDNNISLFTTVFVSPVSNVAPTFYMYFIQDTVVEDGIALVRLEFLPRNPDDLLFKGVLYVTLDGHYAVKRVELGVSKFANLNFVRSFSVRQSFDRDTSGRYFLASSDMFADLGVLSQGFGVYGERSFTYSHFSAPSLLPDSLFQGPSLVELSPSGIRGQDSIMGAGRNAPLTASEAKAYTNVDSLQGMKSYKRIADWLVLLFVGYKQAGPFEIGPVATFYTFNPVEGFKPRLGGRSTTRLSTRYYVESYAAYGLGDQKWKYYGAFSYAFNNKSIYRFPNDYLKVSYMKDTRVPGQIDNNFQQTGLLSFSRGDNTKWLYNDVFRLDFIKEFANHFSIGAGYRYWQQHPAGSIEYLYESSTNFFDTATELTTTQLSATLRWAPHEQFYDGRASRSQIINKYPIFTFQYAHGFKGLQGGEYNFNSYHLNMYKRLYLSPFGFADVTLDGGYISGTLPFPLLSIPTANQSYAYFTNEYNLMNYEEFVSDHWASVYIEDYLNGFLFNKIPFLKKLKLREVVAAKILYGGVRDANNPDLNPFQMKFPTTNNVTSTFVLNGAPYIEASVGVFNILKLLRVDLVKRFTYLDHQGISSFGLRVSTSVSF